MKAVIQRVTKAAVLVNGETVSSIGNGLCVLVGIKIDDTIADAKYIAEKILKLRVFDGATGKRWALNVMDKDFEVLCVSQFTLYHILKGNKLDFHRAMPTSAAEAFYKLFLEELKQKYSSEKIKDGKFGAMMNVQIENDGPVTLEIESPIKENVESVPT